MSTVKNIYLSWLVPEFFLCILVYRGSVEPHREKNVCFFICENKDAYQLRGNREADQRLCFRYIDSTIPQLSKSKISIL